jgi:uncharacterized protein (DUF983 family)
MLLRALRRRCPLCGARDVWKAWGELREHCPDCGYGFEREEGYWVGAMIVNLAVALVAVVAYLVGGLLAFGGRAPSWWVWLSIGLVLTQGIVLYPRSKTLWIWLDLTVHPYEGEERPDRR